MGIETVLILLLLVMIVSEVWSVDENEYYEGCDCCWESNCSCNCPDFEDIEGDPTYEAMLEEFYDKFNQPIETVPQIPKRADLKAKLIEEEAKETADALRRGDLVETVDGLCDLLYVTFGAALEAGVDLYPYFEEVHRTNMNKVGGATREDGKVLKPSGWQPPKIREMLIEKGANL